MTDWPHGAPGSNEAIDAGCRCPVFDNHHGRGRLGEWWVNADCPLHAPKQETESMKRLAEITTSYSTSDIIECTTRGGPGGGWRGETLRVEFIDGTGISREEVSRDR